MDQLNANDDKYLMGWYEFASQQDGFVGYLLKTLKEKQRKTNKQLRKEFGVSKENFVRLAGMPLPRPTQFTRDARRIAELCMLERPEAFVNALLLARNLSREIEAGKEAKITEQSLFTAGYQAALDEHDNLDELPEDSEE